MLSLSVREEESPFPFEPWLLLLLLAGGKNLKFLGL